MPLNLAKLVANRAMAAIDFGGGDVLHVEYFPARLTSRMLLEFADADRLKDLPEVRALAVLTGVTDTLLALLASWDLAETAPDGTEAILPLDRAHVEPLGLAVQWAILRGIANTQANTQAGEAKAPEASVSAPTSGAIS